MSEEESKVEEEKKKEEERRAKLRLFRSLGKTQLHLSIDPNCFHEFELNLVSPVARQDVSEPKSPQIVVNKIDEALRLKDKYLYF